MFEVAFAVYSVSDWEPEGLCKDAVLALWGAGRVVAWKSWACIQFCCWRCVVHIAHDRSVCMRTCTIPLLGVAERNEFTDWLKFLFAFCSVSRQVLCRRCGGVVAAMGCMLGDEKGRKQVGKRLSSCRCCDTVKWKLILLLQWYCPLRELLRRSEEIWEKVALLEVFS